MSPNLPPVAITGGGGTARRHSLPAVKLASSSSVEVGVEPTPPHGRRIHQH